MGADVMRSEGAAHTSIRTGLTRKQTGFITAMTSPQTATSNINQQEEKVWTETKVKKKNKGLKEEQ